jgi:hypothetical protein
MMHRGLRATYGLSFGLAGKRANAEKGQPAYQADVSRVLFKDPGVCRATTTYRSAAVNPNITFGSGLHSRAECLIAVSQRRQVFDRRPLQKKDVFSTGIAWWSLLLYRILRMHVPELYGVDPAKRV